MQRSKLSSLEAALGLGLGLVLAAGGCASTPERQGQAGHGVAIDLALIDDALAGWHDAASVGDFDAYFGAMTDDAVFLGTDASERWTKPEFMGYAREPFSDGEGWTYRPRQRHVAFSADGRTAWADEVLDHDRYGVLRGTAVLELVGHDWKIAHYSLTFLVPNDKAARVVEVIGGPSSASQEP